MDIADPFGGHAVAEGRSAGLEACFAWQFSAQVRDELVRSGVRSLLQSISIFRMREIEDARSLAGLAMDVYSDHISTDREDQERLRFSADDITRLPVHTAINLWNAKGTPRPGFIARTLPMHQLYKPELAAYHLTAQRDRGGRYMPHLPAPLAEPTTEKQPASEPEQPTSRTHAQAANGPAQTEASTRSRVRSKDAGAGQLVLGSGEPTKL